MPKITIASRQLQADSDTCLLDSLLSQGEKIPYSCRSGVCHACMLQSDGGKPPLQSQLLLPREKASAQYFLACQCYPTDDMTVSLPENKPISAIITAIEKPESTLAVLTLSPRQPLSYQPGQHLNISANQRLSKDCYLASSPIDSQPMIYIRRKVGDSFSTWAHEVARVGDKIQLGQPQGIGINVETMNRQLHLICHENHLAPMVAVIKHCSLLKPDAKVTLYCFYTGSTAPDIKHFFEKLSTQYKSFSYHFLKSHEAGKIADTVADLAADVTSDVASDKSESELIISGKRNFIATLESHGLNIRSALKLLPIKERTLR
ncbi:hypothetical protein EOPP23_16510 [Endozoicomonas sp. OPT23]|uniref:2Fe-2S iron-sulfur cluster-binding protein n=1 Tax=Endozoicomonas sp. OPT23 TaxID=2072845 RepID=UPI00129BC2D5|nr:2Fe-2S iron-sulfur cluster-binding protein [Endozoicomonas sp. OPT23]MRI34589.1 hypothetical protein [Endozoicomonas sp. OPT23]